MSLNRKRPRGLWKGRTAAPRFHQDETPKSVLSTHGSDLDYNDIDGDDDDDDLCGRSTSSGSSKRRRFSGQFEADSEEEVEYWEPLSHDAWTPPRPTKIMDTTTIALSGNQDKNTCDYEDWEELKDLFNRALEQYESNDCQKVSPLLRGVIHECHRFLLYYEDPSVLFAPPPRHHSRSPDVLTPPLERLGRDFDSKGNGRKKSPESFTRSRPPELPTAFHSILGTSLFLFGNLIQQVPSLALDGEPNTPCPYWLAALDVFETGENLPSRVNGLSSDAPEDWRMSVVWGRTLVCLADEIVSRDIAARTSGQDGPFVMPFSTDEPRWPRNSPFSTIAARRPPVTRRMSMSSASANDLMVLAMDQFSRGIFHMPHPQHHLHLVPANMSSVTASSPNALAPAADPQVFSRAKELFTIASEVLGVAERLESPVERQYWASWADSVYNQMKMEADMDIWRGQITRARGRCWLIVGSARVEEIEAALENGQNEVLLTEEADEAREGLTTAISFFERAKGSATSADDDKDGLPSMFAEALLTLANLTVDENKREELYTRAQTEGQFDLNAVDMASEDMDQSA